MWIFLLIAGVVGSGVLGLGAASVAAGGSRAHWYQTTLERGEINGYHWAVGAKGPKHKPLNEVCAEISMLEPAQEDALYVEGSDSTDCGRLDRPVDSISSTDSFGSGKERVSVLELIYRPIVRKVVFVLSTGERKAFLPRAPQIAHRSSRGIPVFRYAVFPFEGEVCVRRVTTVDGHEEVISSEARPPCPSGSGNL
jgi:hypothetical protein